jgi:hypothetical protein
MIIVNIISDFVKIINSRLGTGVLFTLFIVNATFLGFLIGLNTELRGGDHVVQVMQTEESLVLDKSENKDEKVIFGSSRGKYFYYKGCGGTTISSKNLVYYKSEADAIAKGKTLYKSCE